MGKLILSMMATLDGFIAGPNNELGWVTWEEKMDKDASRLIERCDAILVGYGAYKDMVGYWPAALTKPSNENEGQFAKLINEKHKIIVSDKNAELLWKNEELLIITDLKSQMEQLKSQYDTLVIYGGVSLAQSLVQEGLVDEFELIISPVALGKGKPLFNNLMVPLIMQGTAIKPYESGAFRLSYSVKK